MPSFRNAIFTNVVRKSVNCVLAFCKAVCFAKKKIRKVTISIVFNTFSFLIVGEDDEYFGFVRKSRSGNLLMSFCPFIRALNLNLAQVFKLLS